MPNTKAQVAPRGAMRGRILDFVTDYYEANGRGPSHGEIADYVGLRSRGTVFRHLANLYDEEKVVWEDRNRGSVRPVIEVNGDQTATIFRSHFGANSAGQSTRTRLLSFIIWYRSNYGVGPTYSEMMAAIDVASKTSILYHLGRLTDEGLITRDGNRHRGLRPLVERVPVSA